MLEPGDILIAPSTDPSWTPLFLVAEGVITDIGAVGTHAVIVSRELGIPCVPSIADASKRIPDRGDDHDQRQPRHRHDRRPAVILTGTESDVFETFGVGLTLPQLGDHVTRDAVRGFCQRAEALGFASLWAQEHLFFALEPSAPYAARPGMPVPEAYRSTMSPLELLTAAAAWTERVVLGTGILVGGYHRPVELAQRVATLDHLSGGRVVVGLSVGWSKDEHDQMDVEFTTRGRRMDELVRRDAGVLGARPGAVRG